MSIYGFSIAKSGGKPGGGYFGIRAWMFSPGTVVPKPPSRISRGRSGNAGSGPYFRATGKLRYYNEESHAYIDEPSFIEGSYGGRKYRFECSVDGSTAINAVTWWEADGTLSYNTEYDLYTFTYPTSGPYRFEYTRTNYYWDYWARKWVKGSTSTGRSRGTPLRIDGYLPDESIYSDLWEEFMTATEGVYLPPGVGQGYSRAYMAAASGIPQADTNLIANIGELIGNVKTAIGAIRNPGKFLASAAELANPKELWLSYRYIYKTNQADAKEMEELISELDRFSAMASSDITLTGSSAGPDCTRYAAIRLPISSVLPSDLIDALHRFGLNVTPSNMWDLVPFSFMADWFLGIGDKLKFLEDWDGITELHPKEVWYMTRAVREDCPVYYRIPGSPPVVPPLYTPKEVSGKVVSMRIADTISIFT